MFGNNSSLFHISQLISARFFPLTSIFDFFSNSSNLPCILHFYSFCRLFFFAFFLRPSQRQTNGFNYSFGKRERNVVDSFFLFAIFQNSTKTKSGKNCCRHVFTIVPIFVASSRHPQPKKSKHRVSIHRRFFFDMNAKWEWNINQYFDTKRYQKSISANLLWFMIMIHIINTKRINVYEFFPWTENKLMIETSSRADERAR